MGHSSFFERVALVVPHASGKNLIGQNKTTLLLQMYRVLPESLPYIHNDLGLEHPREPDQCAYHNQSRWA